MQDKLIQFSIRTPWFAAFIVGILMVWGYLSLKKLPFDAIPDITNKQVNVITLTPSLGPIEVERFITSPIEVELSNIKGIEQIRSISKFGLSSITVVFSDDVDLFWARQQVFERLNYVTENLPANAGVPQLAPITTGIGEIYQYTLQATDPVHHPFSLMELRSLQDWVIRKNLLGTFGVADISSFGGYKKEYQAKLIPERLRAYNVTIEELYNALQNGNNNTGGAYVEKNNRSYIIRGIGLAQNIEDIKNTFVKTHENAPVLVKDLANVEATGATRYGAMTLDGKGETVGAVVLLQMGENASDVIKILEKRMKEVKKLLPHGVEIVPFINRESLVSKTIATVTKNLVEGALVVLLVLFLFLGDWRASLIAASVIPLTMLFTFGMMQSTGVIGNLMSLGALDFGLIVDGSVIVVEGVVMAMGAKIAHVIKPDLKHRQDTVLRAVLQSKDSVFFGTLIILIVYTPILFLSEVEGKMFRPMALTVTYAISGALLLSLTYVPIMCTLFLKPHVHGNFSDRMVDFLHDKVFKPAFIRALNSKWFILSGLTILIILAGFIFTKIGGEFIPKLDEGIIQIETRLPVGSSLTQSIETSLKIEKAILDELPDVVEHVVGKIGTSEIPLDPVPMESTDIIIITKEKSNWKSVNSKAELIDRIMQIYLRFPGIIPSVQQPIEARFNDLLSGSKTDIVFKLYGQDLNTMDHLAKKVMAELSQIQGAKDVQMQVLDGLPQIKVVYNRKNTAVYGITVQQINDVIQTAFAGKTAGIIYEEDRRYDLVLKLESEVRNNIETLQNILLKDYTGKSIPLSQLATISTDVGPAEIRHINKSRCIQVGANARGRDMESIVQEAWQKINKQVPMPYGYYIEAGGQYENLRKAKERLQIVVPIALIIILVLLYASFRKVKDAILIFTAVPMSAIGGIFALYLTNINFSISAGVGFICLFGIAVLNGILLVSNFNSLKSNSLLSVRKIVIMGVKDKFRPVLMTSSVAALGFLPMTLATGSGAEVQRPLAVVVIGGIIVSTVLTLFILPLLYMLINQISKPKSTKA